MEAGAAGAFYAVENVLYGAAAAIKGITHPTLPLKAALTHITSVPLPRAHHTISVVKGRAYIFGGESAPNVLADNDMHIVILPSSGVLDADYTSIPARAEQAQGPVPAPRKGHTAVVIGDSIYVYGGDGVENENGRVWVYHTVRNKWNYLDPAPETSIPVHRTGHASVSSELPGPKDITFREKAPQQPADPANAVPEPADVDSWGTIFVVGGKNPQTGDLLKDSLAFDVRSRTWSNIPTPSGSSLLGVSLAIVGERLYCFGGKSALKETSNMETLDASPIWTHAQDGTLPLSSGWAWEHLGGPSTSTEEASTKPSPATNAVPSSRFNAGLTGVTTGQGRDYLLLVGGSSPAPSSTTTLLDDIWAFQIGSEKGTAAAAKDTIRSGLNRPTHEGHWSEVGYKYVDAKGEEENLGEHVKGVGPRSGFALARGTEVDGATVVVWGGSDADGRVLGDGWLVTVENSGQCLQTLKGHSSSVNSVAFSPDSTRLASGSYDNTVKIWDASSGQCLQILRCYSPSVNSVAFSPDSTRLASGSYDRVVIWDVSSGQCLQILKGHSRSVSSVAFSPDSTRLASGSVNSTIKIWDVSSGRCLQMLKGHSSSVNSVAFSPDSTQLASGSDNVDFLGLGLSTDLKWISYDSEKTLWLPSEYRPSCVTIFKNMIGIGTSHGRIWKCSVERNRPGAS
ncbi:hypothetical protein DM02DRAFT_656712 [Periconia macrospinosa]|uniref:Intraflagellar transport protein 122 homolog n=1 Tax=Periconia macrospinosa TaxID=97972 RepID=A0A2V1DM57_9PLEO|nr:hypothetical protein DM02DRAFT_656712 [Periconia macrospinosa]